MSGLEIFISIVTLFVIGSVLGWIIELFYRRFVSQHHWMNPGLLVGPYLPIYGLGTVALYALSNLDFSSFGIGDTSILGAIIKIAMIGVTMVLLEFIAGLIFIKGLKIKLWDYSDQKGNIMGIISPLYSVAWLIIGAIYYFFINPELVKAVYWLASEKHQIYYFFIGVVLGMILVDFAYSIHLATKLMKIARKNKIIINLDKLREYLKSKSLRARIEKGRKEKKWLEGFFLPFRGTKGDINEEVHEYAKDNENKQGKK
jgi:uncharacterized membrane protein